jgi:hypothetical protein
MNAGLPGLALTVLLISGCASPLTHKEARSQNEKVSLVIMPVIVVSPNRDASDGDSSPSRDDDSHPRTLFLRNLRYPSVGARPDFKHVPEITNPAR